jgi:hypothetical protein
MTGVVYFAMIGDRLKIGHTTRLSGRMRDHRYWYRKPVRLLCWFPGTMRDEREFHDSLHEYRVRPPARGRADELFRVPAADIPEMVEHCKTWWNAKVPA